jgi:hypothetical protein
MFDNLTGTCKIMCNGQYERYDYITRDCECVSGYTRINGKCEPRCQELEIWNGERCICAPGYYYIGVKCDVCPVGRIYNRETRKCDYKCKGYKIFD